MSLVLRLRPELPVPTAPEAVTKTDKSVTLRAQLPTLAPDAEPVGQIQFQVSHSEHGYVYYSWIDSELFTSHRWPVKGLIPNTTYVFRVRVVRLDTQDCSEWSPLSAYIRTFTEEEDAKRSGTYFEHALKLEREQKNQLQSQISKLTVLLEDNARVKSERSPPKKTAQLHEDMLSSRRVMDTTISQLQQELMMQKTALLSLKQQRTADEEMITELLNEQENLRALQSQQQGQVQYELEMQQLREQLEKNEAALRKHQEQVVESHDQISNYEKSLEQKQKEIGEKEAEVERLMADCNRMVQEQADLAAVKQLEVEDALLEAKNSLEQQLDINTYLRDEVSRLREENHHLKNQIEEMDSEVVPKLMKLEDENERLQHALAAANMR